MAPNTPVCPACDQVQVKAPARDALIGRVLAGKYRIESLLGQGGMGNVYLATQNPLELKVVIKTLRSELAHHQEIAQRFYREAKSTSELRHPHCVSILDFGESEGILYIAMEHIRGETLADLYDRDGALPALRVIRIMKQVLEVVEAAHRQAIVHRDLKPENIMIVDLAIEKDFVKVLDFGIAKIIDPLRDDGRLTGDGRVLGTPAYMAPEQAQGKAIDGRSDIYAISVILYELLSGRRPFAGDTAAELLAAHVTEIAAPLRDITTNVPESLCALVERGMAKDPGTRPQTALDFQRALEAVERELIVESGSSEQMLGDDTLSHTPVPTPVGAQLPCSRCGVGVPAVARFCPGCGAPTKKAARQKTAMADRFADLKRYLPSALVEDIAGTKTANATEQRPIMVLAIELRGTKIDDPEHGPDLREELGELLETIAARSAGRVEHSLDGGLLVLFGLTVSHGDDGERAVRTAMMFARELAARSGGAKKNLGAAMAMHRGDVMVRANGSYTAVGDCVSLPSKLAASINVGLIVATRAARSATERAATFRRGTPVAIRSRPNPVAVDEVVGLSDGETVQPKGFPPVPFLGRTDQVERLAKHLAGLSQGQVVHLTGPAGMGKSSFLRALTKSLDEKKAMSVFVAARGEVDAAPDVAFAIRQRVGDSVEALHALGVSDELALTFERIMGGAAVTGLPEPEERTAIVGLLRRVLHSVCQRRMVCLLLDDIHRADGVSRELVRSLLDVPMENLTIVTAARPGYAVPWTEQDAQRVLHVDLPPLGTEQIGNIVRALFDPSPVPSELIDVVTKKSGGSPLFALELMRTLVDVGLIKGADGRWALVGDLRKANIPGGVAEILGARIDALPAYARDVLAVSAAIGSRFPASAVDAVLSPARGQPIDRELELLRERRFLQEGAQSGTLMFCEDSAREAVYERLRGQSRAKLHLAIAAALEQDTHGLPIETVAKHCFKGGRFGKALEFLSRAIEEAVAAGDEGRALAVLRQSVTTADAALEQAGQSSVELATRAASDAWALADTALRLGDLNGLGGVIDSGLRRARQVNDPLLTAKLHRVKGAYLTATGHAQQALDALESALESALGLRDNALSAEIHTDIAAAKEALGQNEVAAGYLLRALELVQTAGVDQVEALALRVLVALGRVSLLGGDTDQAEKYFQQALVMAEQGESHQWAAKVLGNLGGVYHARKQYAVATEFVERALEVATECGDQIGIAKHTNNLGILYFLCGNAAAAKNSFNAAYELSERVGWKEGMAMASAGQVQTGGVK